MNMSLLELLFGPKQRTASIAKERLQLIIARERGSENKVDFLPALQRDLIEVISRYVKINANNITVSLEKQDRYEVLEVNIVLSENDRPR